MVFYKNCSFYLCLVIKKLKRNQHTNNRASLFLSISLAFHTLDLAERYLISLSIDKHPVDMHSLTHSHTHTHIHTLTYTHSHTHTTIVHFTPNTCTSHQKGVYNY